MTKEEIRAMLISIVVDGYLSACRPHEPLLKTPAALMEDFSLWFDAEHYVGR